MKRHLLALLLLAASAARAPGQTTVIRAGRLLDTEAGAAAQNQTIVVEGGKVKAVGAGVEIPKGANVIDLSRSTVLPGLFDAHTHLCLTINLRRDAGSYFYTSIRDPDTYRAVQGAANARDMLAAGFTTVRDVGNEGDYACVSVRRAVAGRLVPGPTMLTAGRIIAPYGGQFHLQPGRRELGEPEYLFADTRDEMRKAVRENVHFGALVIKIVVDDQRYIYSTEDIRFIVEEARAVGMKVAAHAWTTAGIHNAVAAGVASVEHVNAITDEDLAAAKRNGVTLVFTPFPEWVLRELGSTAEEAAKEFRDTGERLAAAYKLGVPIAFGSDAGASIPKYTRGTLSMTWVDSYAAAGVPPRAILQMMTVNAARLLGVERVRGSIRPGMAADIIATPADPLEDIQALKRVNFVMKDGAVFRNDSEARP
ncbi:MAG TPA: amidohydrolase family protein [Pyrinomonadaceae bacterium]|jgi:imidazolonepropionase-like amidohydrolase